MADDNAVDIRFGASTDDALAGIEQVRDALSGLTAPVRGLDDSLAQLNSAFASAVPTGALSQAVKDFGDLGSQAQRSIAPLKDINGEIKLLRLGLTEQKVVLNAEASQFQITQNQKFAMLEAETQKEYEAEATLLQQKEELGNLSVEQRKKVLDKIAELEAKHRVDMIKLDEQAIAQQQQMWTTSLNTIESAFNSQLRGLLAGTTSWSKAFKNILGDIIIKFIEMCEQMVVKWVAAAAGADDGDDERRRGARGGRADRRQLRHSRQRRQRHAGDHDRRRASLRRRFCLPGADHGAGRRRAGGGGAGLGLGRGDLRRRHRLRRARRPRAYSSGRNDHAGARLGAVHRSRAGRADPRAGEHQRLGARFAERRAFLQRQLKAHAARHQ